jgi:hypothetical protein
LARHAGCSSGLDATRLAPRRPHARRHQRRGEGRRLRSPDGQRRHRLFAALVGSAAIPAHRVAQLGIYGGVGCHLLGPPIVHLAHGEPDRAAVSLGLRAVGLLGGAAVLAALTSGGEDDSDGGTAARSSGW